jgi:AhpD family alkylhydroperoxidase
MSTQRILTQKEKELIAIGASIAAGCQPCTGHHFKAARQARATEAEIRQAVDAALGVRNSATQIMTGLAEKHLGNRQEVEPCCSSQTLIGELVSVGAALAVNCTTNLETHLQAARTVDATDRQIQTALGVARAIKKVAAQKAEAITMTVAEPPGGCDDDCGCGETADSQHADVSEDRDSSGLSGNAPEPAGMAVRSCLDWLRKSLPEQIPPPRLWDEIWAEIERGKK